MTDPTRGVLYPARLPTFHRLPAPASVQHLVGWFWIPEWDLAPGRISRQDIVSYPASNLVGLAGSTTRASHRDLTGRGWAVGALLRPAAVPAFTDDPTSLRDGYLRLELPDLHDAVAAAMAADGDGGQRRDRAVGAFTLWLVRHVGLGADVGDEALLANDLADVIDGVDIAVEIRRIEDVADRLGISPRSVQRLARKYVGLPPSAMIRRRRLQEAAERVRSEQGVDLSAVAADLGYADHAHLTNDFRTVLGFTPSAYRAGATGGA